MIDAENAVLGCLTLSSAATSEVLRKVSPEMFSRPEAQELFRILRELREETSDDAISLTDVKVRLDAGGNGHLLGLAASVDVDMPSPSRVLDYIEALREIHLRRHLGAIGLEVGELANEGVDSGRIISLARSRIDDLGTDREDNGPVALREALEVLDEEAHDGIKTGFSGLDSRTLGMGRGQLWYVAARPGIGKSVFVMKIARNVARGGGNVAFFGLEMTARELALRVAAAEAKVDLTRLRSKTLNEGERMALSSSKKDMASLPLYIDDRPGRTVSELTATARDLMRRNSGLDLIVVDYIGLLTSSNSQDNSVARMTELSKQLLTMARRLDVPVLVCSQLNRQCEQRTPPKPVLSDLRESGALEQDAHVVLLLYREDYYRKDGGDDDQIMEVTIGKNRNGEAGGFSARFLGMYSDLVEFRS